jgi:AcrR family transcriptional regulator
MGRHKIIEDDEVLAAARRVFGAVGHAASTREIAAAAGISQAVLYQRFGSKDELFFRSMMPEPPDLDALLGPYPPADAFEDLAAISGRLLAYMRGFMPTMLKVLAFPGLPAERLLDWHAELPFLRIAGALADRFRRMSADGLIGGGDPRAGAVTLMAEVHAVAFFELLTRPGERAHHAIDLGAALGVLWRGFQPRGRRRALTPRARE